MLHGFAHVRNSWRTACGAPGKRTWPWSIGTKVRESQKPPVDSLYGHAARRPSCAPCIERQSLESSPQVALRKQGKEWAPWSSSPAYGQDPKNKKSSAAFKSWVEFPVKTRGTCSVLVPRSGVRIVGSSLISFLARRRSNVEFDRQLILHLDRTAGDANRSNSERTLL